MKKTSILLIFCGLLICSSVFSQLERGMWQMQNPPQPSFNSILSFKGGKVTNSMCDMNNMTGVRQAVGVYKLTGNTLVVLMNNVRYVYTLKWYSQNKLALCAEKATLIYSQSNSPDDQYMSNYLSWNSLNGNSSSGSNYTSTPATNSVCGVCRGLKSCNICKGSGINRHSYTNTQSVCSACSGTGKCWKCGGN